MVTLFLLFWGISRHSSTVAVPVCIPTSSEWGFPFLHNLSKLVICLVDNNIGFWYISMLIDVSLWTFGYFWFFLLFLTAVRNILGYVILFTCVRENSKPREFLGIGVKGSSTLLHNAKLFSKVLNTKFPLADCESSHFIKRIIHFYREEKGGRETSMYERNINVREKHWSVNSRTCPWPARDWTRNPGMCPDQELNWRPFVLQDDAQPTEPHQSGMRVPILPYPYKHWYCQTFNFNFLKRFYLPLE